VEGGAPVFGGVLHFKSIRVGGWGPGGAGGVGKRQKVGVPKKDSWIVGNNTREGASGKKQEPTLLPRPAEGQALSGPRENSRTGGGGGDRYSIRANVIENPRAARGGSILSSPGCSPREKNVGGRKRPGGSGGPLTAPLFKSGGGGLSGGLNTGGGGAGRLFPTIFFFFYPPRRGVRNKTGEGGRGSGEAIKVNSIF